MGMYLGISPLSMENHQKIKAFPPLLWKLQAPDDDAFELALVDFEDPKYNALVSTPLSKQVDYYCDLDKAWHGIHFLLTQTDYGGEFPLGFLLSGGDSLHFSELDGESRLFTDDDVKKIDLALSTIDDNLLTSRFNPKLMTSLDIYPSIIWERDNLEALSYCKTYFADLKKFIEQLVKDHCGMIISIS